MRRAELIGAVDELNRALRESKIEEAMSLYARKTRGKESSDVAAADLLDSLKQYSVKAHNFSPTTRELVGIFALEQLENPRFWAHVISVVPSPRLNEMRWNINFAKEYLPKIVEIIRQGSFTLANELGEGVGTPFKDKDILSIVVIEENNRFSSPERLVEVLQSIDELYEACAVMLGLNPDGLSVIACDSGSDKSFDFLGAAKVIECIKEIILSLWDRIVFFRERQLSQRIELIAGALPVIDQIGVLEQENKIGREQAEILRRKIVGGVGKFIESGAIIPEIEGRSYFNPRALMAPEPKLLVEAPEEITSQESSTGQFATREFTEVENTNSLADIDIKNLDSDEQTELLRLLRKTQRAREKDSSESVTDVEQGVDATDES